MWKSVFQTQLDWCTYKLTGNKLTSVKRLIGNIFCVWAWRHHILKKASTDNLVHLRKKKSQWNLLHTYLIYLWGIMIWLCPLLFMSSHAHSFFMTYNWSCRWEKRGWWVGQHPHSGISEGEESRCSREALLRAHPEVGNPMRCKKNVMINKKN